jgi:ATP-dependent Clp endopeptidase proteolytic subunit ClpP
MSNLIVLNDTIGWGESSPDFVRKKLDSFNSQSVDVEINSPGGNVFEGLEIFHLFKNYPGFVNMHLVSIAASMASTILLAGDKITAEESSVIMIHNASTCVCGDSTEFQKAANYLKSVNNLIANIVSKKTGMELKKVLSLMDDETFFFGDESLKAGLVDKIIKLPEKNIESKSDSIAYAKLKIEDCNKKMKLENRK